MHASANGKTSVQTSSHFDLVGALRPATPGGVVTRPLFLDHLIPPHRTPSLLHALLSPSLRVNLPHPASSATRTALWLWSHLCCAVYKRAHALIFRSSNSLLSARHLSSISRLRFLSLSFPRILTQPLVSTYSPLQGARYTTRSRETVLQEEGSGRELDWRQQSQGWKSFGTRIEMMWSLDVVAELSNLFAMIWLHLPFVESFGRGMQNDFLLRQLVALQVKSHNNVAHFSCTPCIGCNLQAKYDTREKQESDIPNVDNAPLLHPCALRKPNARSKKVCCRYKMKTRKNNNRIWCRRVDTTSADACDL